MAAAAGEPEAGDGHRRRRERAGREGAGPLTAGLVLDASAVYDALLRAHAPWIGRASVLCAPDLLGVEVLGAVRRDLLRGRLEVDRAEAALEDLEALDVALLPTRRLLRRAWELRENIAASDGCYVALAEVLGYPLVSADRRLAAAVEVHTGVAVELV